MPSASWDALVSFTINPLAPASRARRTYRLAGERHQFCIPNRGRHINTAGELRTGHFDIEKHHIRVIPVDRGKNLVAATNLRDHLNIVLKP